MVRTVALVTGLAVMVLVVTFGAHDSRAGFLEEFYAVDTTTDNPAFTTCNNFAGPVDCSLRGAIQRANGDGKPSTIYFQIDTGIKTITLDVLHGALPPITAPVFINGSTQVRSGGMTCFLVQAQPCILLSGINLPVANGITVESTGATINGLGIINFGQGAGIMVRAGGAGTIKRNYIGTGNGTTAAANAYGIFVQEGAGAVTIGGSNIVDRNVISANLFDGIWLEGSGSSVQGNIIGTNDLGTAALGNAVRGVVAFGNENEIGTDTSGAGNLISGNKVGVAANGNNNTIKGNRIGWNLNSSAAIPNETGVLLLGNNNTVGGSTNGGEINLIAGNSGAGVDVRGSGNVIAGNRIGWITTGLPPVAKRYRSNCAEQCDEHNDWSESRG